MLDLLRIAVGSLLANLRLRRDLALENLALRQQVAVLRRAARKPRLSDAGRLFWDALVHFWSRWAEVLAIVRPKTVRWHHAGFRRYGT